MQLKLLWIYKMAPHLIIYLKRKIELLVFSLIKGVLYKKGIICIKKDKSIKSDVPIPINVIRKILNLTNQGTVPNLDDGVYYIRYQRHIENYEIFFDCLNYIDNEHLDFIQDTSKGKTFIIHGQNITWETLKHLISAVDNNCKVLYGEDGFIHSIGRSVDYTIEKKYRIGCSLVLDNSCAHFDCRFPSLLEQKLESDYTYTEDEILRARRCISYIIDNYISKYNNQPIYLPDYLLGNQKKILVIDQAIGDFSIKFGECNDNTFMKMLEDALEENPDAVVLIKIHPDMINNPKRGSSYNMHLGHYTNSDPNKYNKRIKFISDYLNPIMLLKHVDKVYVATSQMGFEALLCGKEVFIYGVPYYAGWGVGTCRSKSQALKRRTQKRSIEEIFYAAYIQYSLYINPKYGHRCEIEEALGYLKNLRDEFFLQNNIKHEQIPLKIENKTIETLAIPVVFCFDKNYHNQVIVAIWSLLKSNQNPNTIYELYLIYEKNVTSYELKKIDEVIKYLPHLKKVHFIENTLLCFDNAYECRGITKTAYIRLLLHKLLPKLNKIIYSDVDVIFNGSLADLYSTELGNYVAAACIDVGINDSRRYKSILNKNEIWKYNLWDKEGKYYSSGILLLNLNEMRRLSKDQQICDLSLCNLPYQDMDILNILFNKKIIPISSKYCVIPRYMKNGYMNAFKEGIIPYQYAIDAIKTPLIYHFAGKKPWNKKIKFNDIWWNYVKKHKELKALF